MLQLLVPLAQTSIRDPQSGARAVLAMGLPRDVLWTALALVAIANAFIVLLVVNTSSSTPPKFSFAILLCI